MTEIVGLDGKARTVEVNPDVHTGVVNLLETILGWAKEGKVASVGIVYTTDEGDYMRYQSSWQGPRVTLLGAFTRALYALNRELDAGDTGTIGDGTDSKL